MAEVKSNVNTDVPNTAITSQEVHAGFGRVYVEYWNAQRNKTVRICRTEEFSTPTTLETIPFPAGVTEFLDLPESFMAACQKRANQLGAAA